MNVGGQHGEGRCRDYYYEEEEEEDDYDIAKRAHFSQWFALAGNITMTVMSSPNDIMAAASRTKIAIKTAVSPCYLELREAPAIFVATQGNNGGCS